MLGIDTEGKKEVLGIWVDKTESATFWNEIFEEKKIYKKCNKNVIKAENVVAVTHTHTHTHGYFTYWQEKDKSYKIRTNKTNKKI